MSMKNAFRELAIAKAKKQTKVIDALTEEAPILASMPMEPASHGIVNVFEEITTVSGADMVDLDAPLPTVDASGKLLQTNLSAIGGKIEVGEDKARRFGGAQAYFAKKLPVILRKTGMDIEANILYNVIRKYAFDNGKLDTAGGASDKNYSLLVVHWVPGEITGLYDEEGFGNGKAFDFSPISGGNLYENSLKQLVYGLRMKSYCGVQLANKLYVSGLVNIDLENSKLPTKKQITQALLDARAGANSFIYCHPAVKSALGSEYKLEHIQFQNSDNQVNSVLDAWDGIPFQTSYNFLAGTEADVELA